MYSFISAKFLQILLAADKAASNNCFNDRHVIFPSPYLQRAKKHYTRKQNGEKNKKFKKN